MTAERIPPGRILTLGGLSAFGPLSLDLYLPALPQLTASLETTDSLGQASMSVCMIGLAVGQLLFGPVTDRYGRRIPLLIGVAAFAGTAGLCAVAPSIEVLLVLRLLTGLAGAVGIVTARAIVRDLYDGPAVARMFSLLMLVNGAAPILAPVLGSQLLRVADWRGLFLALAVIGAVLLLAALAQAETLPSSARRTDGPAGTRRAIGQVLTDRSFVVPVLVLSLAATGMFVYIALGSYVLQDGYGLSAQAYGIVFAANALGIMAAGRVSSVLADRVGPLPVLRSGVVTALAGAIALLAGVLTTGAVWAVLVPLFFVVSSVGLLMPNGTALALDGQKEVAGTASGVLGLCQFAFGAVIPPVVSLGGVTRVSMAVTILAVVAAGAAVSLVLRPPRPAA